MTPNTMGKDSAALIWGRLIAAGMLLVSSPLILGLLLLVRLTSRGPALYRQQRVGRHGRHFTLYKIRTMRLDAEVASGPVWCQDNDPRITRLGRLMRATHLDELPQLWNLLRGDMALIGPRPERPEFVEHLAMVIPGYLKRLTVRPGITGLAQVNLPGDTDYESVWRKLYLDLEHMERATWWLNTRIVICTALRLLGISRERATHWLSIHRDPPRGVFQPVMNGDRPTPFPNLFATGARVDGHSSLAPTGLTSNSIANVN